MHGNVLINMWHNYSRGKNVIMTSSILAFSDDATTQKHVFKVAFFLHLFEVIDQNQLYNFKDLIFIFL